MFMICPIQFKFLLRLDFFVLFVTFCQKGVKLVLTIKEYLKEHPEYYDTNLPLLPLMHSCECFDARGVFTKQELEARICNVFKEKLLYFYYGKPSYPVGEKVKNFRTDYEYLPVCFILDLRKISIYKVYPFDSGAFFANIYEDFIHRKMTIDSFELPGDGKSIKTYLSFMFGNNDQYLNGVGIKRIFNNEPYLNALVNIMTAEGSMKFDERARTIEVISKNGVKLKDALKCVIIPKNLLQDKNICEFLNNNNIEYIPYDVRPLAHPTTYYGQIVGEVSKYIEKQKGALLV